MCDLWTNNRERAATQHDALLRPRAAGDSASRRAAGAEGRRRRHHRHAGALAFADAEGTRRRPARTPTARSRWATCWRRSRPRATPSSSATSSCRSGRSIAASPTSSRRGRPCGTGVLGDVSKYEIVWNYNGPRWRGRPEVKQIREQDTDWKTWLMTKPYRPFDPQPVLRVPPVSGVLERHPRSVDEPRHRSGALLHERSRRRARSWRTAASSRGTTDARTPTRSRRSSSTRTFLVSYSTSFGNDSRQLFTHHGKEGDAHQHRRRGEPAMEGGRRERQPRRQSHDRACRNAGSRCRATASRVRSTSATRTCRHISNWFECLRSRNTQTNATVDNGYLHSVAIIMAAQSYWQGKRLYYDAASERISDSVPTH